MICRHWKTTTHLESLDLGGIEVRSISPLMKLVGLKWLYLQVNRVSDEKVAENLGGRCPAVLFADILSRN